MHKKSDMIKRKETIRLVILFGSERAQGHFGRDKSAIYRTRLGVHLAYIREPYALKTSDKFGALLEKTERKDGLRARVFEQHRVRERAADIAEYRTKPLAIIVDYGGVVARKILRRRFDILYHIDDMPVLVIPGRDHVGMLDDADKRKALIRYVDPIIIA